MGQGVAVDHRQVGEGAGTHHAKRGGQELSGLPRRRDQRLIGREAITHHRPKVHVQADAIEIDRRIGARDDPAARADRAHHLGDIGLQRRQHRGAVGGGQGGHLRRARLQPGVFPRRIEGAGARIVDQRPVVGEKGRRGEKRRGARRIAVEENRGDVLVDAAQGADRAAVAGARRGPHVLHPVHAEGHGREVVVRGQRRAARVGPLHHRLLVRRREADVGLDQVVGQRFDPLQLQRHLAWFGHRPHEVVEDARAVDGLAGGKVARPDPGSRVDRLAVFDHVVGRTAGGARGRHSKRQPQPAVPVSVAIALHLPVGVHLYQPWHHRMG